ncbi:MAG: hypothetical protein ACI9FJ_001847, partial [Alteromonadaceae bacterium]
SNPATWSLLQKVDVGLEKQMPNRHNPLSRRPP